MCWSLFLKSCRLSGLQLYLKETPAQVFSCEYCQIFKNTYFEEPLRTAAFLENAYRTHPLNSGR